MKVCRTCGVRKDQADFYRSRNAADGHMGECKECARERRHAWYVGNRDRAIAAVQEWRRRNPERYRATQEQHRLRRRSEQRADHLKRTFGLTLDGYDELLAAQDGACAICNEAPQGIRFLHVDHDHLSGAIRGLLCVRCNNGIGLLRDSGELAQRAVDYPAKTDDEARELHDLATVRARELITSRS